MWMYQGVSDPTRVGREELSTNEVQKSVRAITTLAVDDDFPGLPLVAPYGEDKELLEVSPVFLILP